MVQSNANRTATHLRDEQDEQDETADTQDHRDERPTHVGVRRWIASHRVVAASIAAAFVALVTAGVFVWRHMQTFETTDDAQIDGDISALSSRVTGIVTAVHVVDNQHVNAGDLLLELDPMDAKVAVARAEADVARARARNGLEQLDLRRSKQLVATGAVSHEDLDQHTASSHSAMAELKVAEAALEQAQLNLTYTRVIAPVSGTVGKKSVNVGDYVQPGQRLLGVVQSENLWVTANFKETQLKHMHPGESAQVTVDAYGTTYDAQIEAMPGASGPRFSLFPPENATGNYVKVVQRLPVRLRFRPGQGGLDRLRPGMSVEPKVYVR